jgi:DNA-binding LacI/PurR family transcriptional regulator
MPTVSDVARLAAVSPGVVSRLLNGDETLRIREETKTRVLAAARELDYAPNYAARALRKARSGLIAIGVHDATNPIYSAIIEGAQSAATEAGYALMLADVDALAHDDAAFRRIITGGAIDGLLLQRAGTRSDTLIEKIAAGSVPTVLLNDHTRGSIGSIAVDDYAAAHLATSHLVELGHRRIALLQVDGPKSRTDRRRRGWEDALREAGLDVDSDLVVNGGHTPESGEAGMRKLLAKNGDFTAVFVANILSAIGGLTSAREAGRSVPDDLSIVAMHDFPLAAHLSPALTSVQLPMAEMGARALRMLLDRLDKKPAAHEVVSSPGPVLVLRDSTRRLDRSGA